MTRIDDARMLWNDPAPGVMRHAGDGDARGRGLDLPGPG